MISHIAYVGQMNLGQDLGMGKTKVLMRQEYGDESDWKEHFNYLLPFFKNKNYLNIKINRYL